jgi:hypothetical protein
VAALNDRLVMREAFRVSVSLPRPRICQEENQSFLYCRNFFSGAISSQLSQRSERPRETPLAGLCVCKTFLFYGAPTSGMAWCVPARVQAFSPWGSSSGAHHARSPPSAALGAELALCDFFLSGPLHLIGLREKSHARDLRRCVF